MRVSLTTMQQLCANKNLDSIIPSSDLTELITLATHRLGGIEGYSYTGLAYEGVVVVKVISCRDHENSDHLHVCLVDDGGVTPDVQRNKEGFVQVVCGAPNVREGMHAVWLPPGKTVPSSRHLSEPLVLESREIRGVLSHGMLASAHELDFYDDHDGIVELLEGDCGEDIVPGKLINDICGCDDFLIDIENKMLTHRPDGFGQVGIAREVTGILGLQFESPEWYLHESSFNSSSDIYVESQNELLEKVPRFIVCPVDDISVKQSPLWLKIYLHKMGIKPINSIVDLSNYYMHLTGQPTHAFDYDKIKKISKGNVAVYPRMAKKGEKLKLLNGKEIILTDEDIVIANDSRPLALAGIMGGSETEVDDNTTRIVLECATFDMYTIRRSSMRHGLFTDAVTRYTKGQSPLQNKLIISKMISELAEAGAKPGMIYDSGEPIVRFQQPISITAEFINSRLGTELTVKDITTLLQNVEIGCSENNGELTIIPPFWRTDLELREDIIEEVGRLYGFDRLDLSLPYRTIIAPERNKIFEFKKALRHRLASLGGHEVLSYSFVRGDHLKNVGIQEPEKWCYHVRNAISPDLQYYRPTLIVSLLSKIHSNMKSDYIREGDNEFVLFEIGKAHVKGHESFDDDLIDPRREKIKLPDEFERLAMVYSADDKTSARKYSGSAYYMVKKYVDDITNGLATYEPLTSNEYPITSAYELGRSAMIYVAGELLGVIGEFRTRTLKSFKLPQFSAGCEMDISLLSQHVKKTSYSPIGTFPKTQQDLTLVHSAQISFGQLQHAVTEVLEESSRLHGYITTLKPRDIYAANDNTLHTTFRLWVHHPHKTLTVEETNQLLDTIARYCKEELGADRV